MRFFYLWSFLIVFALFSWSWGCLFEEPNLEGWHCRTSDECLGSLECFKGICRRSCQTDRDCLAGQVCQKNHCLTSQDGGSSDAEPCIKTREICNGKDDDCNGLIDDNITCLTEGEECDPYSKDYVGCQVGLVCTTFFPSRPRICLKKCDDSHSCIDGHSQCLKSFDDVEACLPKCTSLKDCSYTAKTPHECISIGGGVQYCLAIYETGDISYGGICDPTRKQYCKSQYVCVRGKSASQGVCTMRCTSDSSCSSLSANAVCQTIGHSSYRYCFFSCADQLKCPQGTICQSSNHICLPE